MGAIRKGAISTAWAELIGLFVDDGSLAVAVLAWVVACRIVLPWLGGAHAWPPIMLFAGLVALLGESAVRRARPRS